MTPQQAFDRMVAQGDMVLDQLDRCAQRLGDKTYLHYGEDRLSLSFAQVKAETDRMAAGLAGLGLQPGQPVSVLTRNSLVSALAMFAIWRAGGVFAPVNFNFRGPLLSYQLNDTAPFALVTDTSFAPVLGEVAGELNLQRLIVHEPRPGDHDHQADSIPERFPSSMELHNFAALRRHAGSVPRIERTPMDVANIVYTSGTTGPSKGVVQPFRWMNHYSASLREGTTEEDVLYCDLPLYHVGGAFALLTRALWKGNTVGLWNRFSSHHFWDRIAECGASCCILLDVMIPWLMKAPPRPSDRANTLNKVHMQPLPVNHNEVARRFGLDFVSCGFGQTESGSGFACVIDELGDQQGTPAPLWKGLSKAEYRQHCENFGRLVVRGDQTLPKGFMGRPNPVLEVGIVDEQDNQLPPGTVGQLVFRPRFPGLILKEYFRKPEATARVLANCWFHTGDACVEVADAPGTYAFVDRMGGFFRVRGENVSSFEVEALMARHSKVRGVAAVPIPAQVGDEDDIALFVELIEAQSQSEEEFEEELRAHAQSIMPRHMHPRYIRFVEALPVTATNKIEKYKLKRALLEELGLLP